MQVSPLEYANFCAFLQQSCGISLGQNKQYLVVTRVRRIVRDNKLASLADLTALIQKPSARDIRQQVIDAMTTNETFWFRDNYPFDYLQRVLLPKYQREKTRSVKIWSAACSSGQEPISLNIIVDEYCRKLGGPKPFTVDVVGTDLSSAMLEQAKSGLYDRISITRGLSAERMSQYFEQVDPDTWRAKSSIKDSIQFRTLNLQDSYFLMGKFDIIFCRNVLIYFSQELKLEILRKMHAQLNKNGLLFLGSSESIAGMNDYFEMVDCSPGVAYRAL